MRAYQLLRYLLILLFALALTGSLQAAASAPSPWRAKVDEWVLDTASRGETEFLVYLDEQADLSGAAHLKTKLEKGTYVYEQLRQTAQSTQGPLLAALQRAGVEYQPFYIANMVWVRGDLAAVEDMARRQDVGHIYANPRVRLALPEPPSGLEAGLAPASPAAIEWNINKVGAPRVWEEGITGQDVVVGGQDTGYEWTVPALKGKYRGWNGLTAEHAYNWHDAIHSGGGICGPDAAAPCDDHYHGTHTMGTIVGDDGLGHQIGMAPGAKWIGCRNMDQGEGTPATYSECYEWFIAPYVGDHEEPRPDLAPDVINNSWGCPTAEGCTDPNVLLEVVEAVRAAGILTVHSAGNSGSSCGSIIDPAAIYDASFTVGSTTSTDAISSFSSRGPVTVDGSGRLKPDISAPGSSVSSCIPSRFGTYTSLSGTSMAAPHVAGLAALLISALPSLRGQVDELEWLIERTAVPLTISQICGGVSGYKVPNNTFGWGRIDAWAAYNGHALLLEKTGSEALISPGEVLTYTLTLTHAAVITPTRNIVITDTLPAGASLVYATPPYSQDGATIRWDFTELAANGAVQVKLAVQAPTGDGYGMLNPLYGARSDDAPTWLGLPVWTPFLGRIFYFPFIPFGP